MSLFLRFFTTAHLVATQKLVQAITGLGTALIVIHFLSPEEQGYYYAMGSLLSSYAILDFGLSSYLFQRSAQISSNLKICNSGEILPHGTKRDEFLSLTKLTFSWYRNLGVISALLLGPIGFYILDSSSGQNNLTAWLLPWTLIVIMVGINMPTIGFLSILEGAGLIKEVYLIRTICYIIGSLLAWVLISINFGLYALSMPVVTTTLVCYGWYLLMYKKKWVATYKMEFKSFTKSIAPDLKHTFSALLTNYIFLNIPVLITFVSGKTILSGQLGISVVIANVGGAIALSSLTAKMPTIIKLITTGNRLKAHRQFLVGLSSFWIIYALGSFVFIAILLTLNLPVITSRLLTPIDLGLLLFAFAGFHTLTACIIYLRANGENRISLVALGLTCLMIPAGYMLSNFGTKGVLFSMIILINILCFLAIKNITSLPIADSSTVDGIS